MKKIWEVKIGNNWSTHIIKAVDYRKAAIKALKISGATGKEKFISGVQLIAKVEA